MHHLVRLSAYRKQHDRSADKEQRLAALLPGMGTGTGTTGSCRTAANVRLTSHSPKSFFTKRVGEFFQPYPQL